MKWYKIEEKLPEKGQLVLATYVGVYAPRVVTFWRDGSNMHFGTAAEPDGRGSQPATHWAEISDTPA